MSQDAINISVLPAEVWSHTLSFVADDLSSIAAAGAACKALMEVQGEEFWQARHAERYPGQAAVDSSSMRTAFRVRLRMARRELVELPITDCVRLHEGSRSEWSPSSAGAAAGSPTECSARLRYSAATVGGTTSEADFKRACDRLATLVVDGQVAADDIIEWLRSDCSPIKALAALAVLQRRNLRSECEPHGLDLRRAPLTRALQQLRSQPAAATLAVLASHVTLKWSSWSSARDCRGFRARDDVHRLSPSLHELLMVVGDGEELPRGASASDLASSSPASELSDAERFWRVLTRGVVNEIRAIHLMVEP